MVDKKLNFFNSADDFSIPFFEYEPKGKIKSAIVLIYEIFGATDHIHSFSKLLAQKGYLVCIPDIFYRIEKNIKLNYNKDGFEKGLSLKDRLGWDYPVMDMVALASMLKQRFKVTCFGFCYGGSLAWLASQKSFLFDNAVCYYGSSIPDFLEKKINNPTICHFGKLDHGIPQEKIQKVKDYANEQKHEIIIHEYEDSDHGFNCEDRKSYNSIASKSALERSLEFIDKENE